MGFDHKVLFGRLLLVSTGFLLFTGCLFPDYDKDFVKLLRVVVEEIAANNDGIELIEIDHEAVVAIVKHVPSGETFTVELSSLYDGRLDLDINGVQQAFTFNANELVVEVRGGAFTFTSGGSVFKGSDGSRLWHYDAIDTARYPEWLPRIEPMEPVSLLIADGDNNGSYRFVFHGSEDQLLAKIESAFAEKDVPRINREDRDGEIVLVYEPPEPANSLILTLQPSPESIWQGTVDYY